MAAPAETKLGRYTLLELLGTGGMAEVWRARLDGPAGFNRELVVKRILPHLARDQKLVQLFLNEARVSSRLQHPNIVPVFELGEEGGWFFLSMEYLRGCDVLRLLQAGGHAGTASAPGLAAYTIAEVCHALAYAHAYVNPAEGLRGIIHRDVSPSNIMLTDAGHVKLLDFGIAKVQALTENLTEPGTLKGKIGYVSPQQANGEPIDHRADLFSAGVVLHEMLTGKRLFRGEDPVSTIALIRDAVVAAPSSINAAVSPRLDEICLRALARDVGDRFQRADEMAAALDEEAQRLGWGATHTARLVAPLLETRARGATYADIGATASLPGDLTTPEHRAPVHADALGSSAVAPKRRSPAAVVAAFLGTIAIAVAAWLSLHHRTPPIATSTAASAPTVPAPTAPTATAPVGAPPITAAPPPPPINEPVAALKKDPPRRAPATQVTKHHTRATSNGHHKGVDFESARLPD